MRAMSKTPNKVAWGARSVTGESSASWFLLSTGKQVTPALTLFV